MAEGRIPKSSAESRHHGVQLHVGWIMGTGPSAEQQGCNGKGEIHCSAELAGGIQEGECSCPRWNIPWFCINNFQ